MTIAPSAMQKMVLPFDAKSAARADLAPGTCYAIDGGEGWIYYGQVSPDKSIGFFRIRTAELVSPVEIASVPLMSRIGVAYPSIGRAMRLGKWLKIGHSDLHPAFQQPRLTVQWPDRTLVVTVWCDGTAIYDTRVEDPRIQEFEVIAAWDAVAHIPERLKADYGAERAEWHVAGPVWRARLVKEEFARRSDAPWHQLPHDWVPVAAYKS